MNKEDAISIIIESINSDNKELCIRSGMTEAEAETQIEQSQPSLHFMMENALNKLIDAGLAISQ